LIDSILSPCIVNGLIDPILRDIVTHTVMIIFN
jgi:hypothetical protein